MLVELKTVRDRIMDFLAQSNICGALFMVSGKEPTGDIREDLKHVRASCFLDVSLVATGNFNSTVTLSHRNSNSRYPGYGAKFYQDGSQNDLLYVQAFPVRIYPQDTQATYDGTNVLGLLRNYSGYFPQNTREYEFYPTGGYTGGTPGAMIADYGTEFDFRKFTMMAYNTTNYTTIQIDYSLDGVTWTNVPVTARTGYVNFKARYIRYTGLSNAAKGFVYLWEVLPKDNAFVNETIDKIVLIRPTGDLSYSSDMVDGVKNNYIGLILDVGTDITISDTVARDGISPNIHSARIALPSSVMEAS
ncbi:hypothetical protein JA33_073 [Dickeya phage vB_DsoM_JA33]|uniref:Uncharacterized protein n=1 Tax=Dickeya phage vB_DsoM_JA33 TaxID=2283032 RepID=A0A384ZZ08_9CAUD|nr:hypothetical protein JA33_073 [Dickeya phage vB_DsoM_JA33]